MRSSDGFLRAAWVAVLVAAVGCSDPATGADASGPADEDARTPGGDVDARSSITIHGAVVNSANFEPLQGVEVALVDRPEVPAAQTDADGEFRLAGAPAHASVILRISKETYSVTLSRILQTTDADFEYGLTYVAPLSLVELSAELLGQPYHDDAVVVFVSCRDAQGPLAGCTTALDPMTGIGPVYLNAGGFPDQSLTETSSAGFAIFIPDAPGSHELSLVHPELPSCHATGPDAPESPIAVRTLPGTSVIVRGICTTGSGARQ